MSRCNTAKHTPEELKRLQALPLEDKIRLTKLRIAEFYEHFAGKVYISFSGGKDSTVLLHIARELYPGIKAVYFDTGLEFPEIKKHVKEFDNVDILHPEKSFRQVIDEYGWVFPSKEASRKIYYARKGAPWATNMLNGLDSTGRQSSKYCQRFIKWAGLVDAPFEISEKCCDLMKKKVAERYTKDTKKYPIIATMAAESAMRKNRWMVTGCNAYDAKIPHGKPMSFWTEQDVLQYIRENNIPIASVYGEIIEGDGKLRTTGETRTGCVFCLIGCHLEKGDHRRFVRLAKTHPKIYKYCMEKLGMKEILDYIQEYTGCEKLYE